MYHSFELSFSPLSRKIITGWRKKMLLKLQSVSLPASQSASQPAQSECWPKIWPVIFSFTQRATRNWDCGQIPLLDTYTKDKSSFSNINPRLVSLFRLGAEICNFFSNISLRLAKFGTHTLKISKIQHTWQFHTQDSIIIWAPEIHVWQMLWRGFFEMRVLSYSWDSCWKYAQYSTDSLMFDQIQNGEFGSEGSQARREVEGPRPLTPWTKTCSFDKKKTWNCIEHDLVVTRLPRNLFRSLDWICRAVFRAHCRRLNSFK